MAFAATPAALAGNVLELGYVVDVAGSTVLKANYRADIGGDSFEASLNGKTSGISNFFSGYKMNQSAAGMRREETSSVRPSRDQLGASHTPSPV